MSTIIHSSPLPPIEDPAVPLTTYVLRKADEVPDRLAICDAAGTSSFTFSELRHTVQSIAGGLQARGFGPGNVQAIMALNSPKYAAAIHGAAVAGGAVTMINPLYRENEIRFQLEDTAATVLVTGADFLQKAQEAAVGTAIEHIVVIDSEEALDWDDGSGAIAFADLLGEPIEQVPVDLDATVAIPYSSGTTGMPKGVMLTHRNLVINNEQLRHTLIFGDDEVALAPMPFFHIYGLQGLINSLLSNGVTLVTMPRFDLEVALQAAEKYKATRFYAVPPIVLSLAKSPLVDQYDLSSVQHIFSGAAPLGLDLVEEVCARIGCELAQGFGMTELSPVSHCSIQGVYRPGTSGVAVSNTEVRIVDTETGEDQGTNSRGELWVRGPQVMKGYLNNPEATAATIDADGWLHTGDIAIVDDHDHITIVDRLKELIKYNGFQVAPAELEAVILTHPDVADVAVIGVPDEAAGELPKAFVVPRPGKSITLDELQEMLTEQLVSYKQVRQMELIEAIPKSQAGKILRRQLRDG